MTKESGDEWIRTAVEEYSRPLTHYAFHLMGDLDRARDVVQDTFVKLCAQEHAAVACKLKEWLYTVCRNRALDVLRKERRMSPLADDYEPSADGPDAAHSLEKQEEAAGLLRALEKLPPNQREVIRLKFLHGHSYREISHITRLSESNVGFLIHTGLKSLRRKLAFSPGLPDSERSAV